MPQPLAVIGLVVAALLTASLPARAAELETVFFNNDQATVETQARTRLKEAPDDAIANAWLAECTMKAGKWDEAQAALARAGTRSVQGLLAHGDYAWYTGDFAPALGFYRAAREQALGDSHAAWGVAASLLHLGRTQEAFELGKQLAGSPGLEPAFHAWVLLLVGACRGLQGTQGNMLEQFHLASEVRADFEQAQVLAPKDPQVLGALGRFFLLAPPLIGDNGKAIDLLERANTLDPFYYLNDLTLIRAYLKTAQVAKARVEKAFYQAKFAGLAQPAAELQLVTF